MLTVFMICCYRGHGDISEIPNAPTKVIGGFSLPSLLMADEKEDRVYVSDRGQNVVKIFSKNGDLVGTIDQGFNNPGGILMSGTGLLYIVDLFNHRIVITNMEGELQGTIGDSTIFNVPVDIINGPDGLLYVTEWSNFRVHVLTPDGQSYKTLNLADRPVGIAFGPDGYMHVALSLTNRIVVLDVYGNQVKSININYPIQIDNDHRGNIYVGGGIPAQVKIYDQEYNLLKSMRGFTTTQGRGIAHLGNTIYTTDWNGGKMYIF